MPVPSSNWIRAREVFACQCRQQQARTHSTVKGRPEIAKQICASPGVITTGIRRKLISDELTAIGPLFERTLRLR